MIKHNIIFLFLISSIPLTAMIKRPLIIKNIQTHQTIRNYSRQHFTNKHCICIKLDEKESFVCRSKLDCDTRLFAAFKKLHETLEKYASDNGIAHAAFEELDMVKLIAGCPKNLGSISRTFTGDFESHKLMVKKALDKQQRLIEKKKKKKELSDGIYELAQEINRR